MAREVLTALKLGANAAGSGPLRLQNAEWITARNAANSADLNLIRVNATDEAEITPTLKLGGGIQLGSPASAFSDRITVKGSTADNTASSWYAVDSNGALTSRITNSGRLDLKSYATDGGICVLDYLPASPLVNTRAGHYAFGNKDSAGNRQTISTMESWIRDITPGSVDSEISLGYMVNQNCTGLSDQQPNTKVVFSASGSVVPTAPIILGAVPATAGIGIRMPQLGDLQWRNIGNTANIIGVAMNSSDQLLLGAPGGVVMSQTITDPAVSAVAMSPVMTLSTDNKALLAAFPIVVPSGGTRSAIYGLNFVPVLFGTEGVTTNPVTNMVGSLFKIDTNAAYDSAGTLWRAIELGSPVHAGGGTIATYAALYSNIAVSITRITNLYAQYHAGAAAHFFGGQVQFGAGFTGGFASMMKWGE